MLQWDTQWSPSSSSYRDCDSQNYARKAPPYLTGAFHLTRKTAAYNLRDSNFNLALEIQKNPPSFHPSIYIYICLIICLYVCVSIYSGTSLWDKQILYLNTIAIKHKHVKACETV